MAHDTDTADGFTEGFAAAFGYLRWTLEDGKRRLEAELDQQGVERSSPPSPRVAEDPGGGATYCVTLMYNPYFSHYCVDVTSGYAWYVPR